MQAMTLTQYGSTAGFTLSEAAEPAIKAGHIKVQIAASSVNPVDYKIRELGEALPFSPALPAILGMDFAGTVTEIGEGVEQFKVGDEVFGCAGGLGDLQGTLAEVIVADANLVAHKPKNLSMAQAAALPLVGITAYEGLHRAGVKAGQNVLVHGGTGGVGHVAVQLAKHFGAKVFATCGGESQAEIIESYGATAINYKTDNAEAYTETHTGGVGFDVIYDTVGDANLYNSFQAAALNGHIATTVAMSEIDLTLAHIKGLSVHVVFMLLPMIHNINRSAHGEILKALATIAEAGGLTPLLAEKQFTLAETAAAHDYAEQGKPMGKVVITV